jgi:hypothetical protein
LRRVRIHKLFLRNAVPRRASRKGGDVAVLPEASAEIRNAIQDFVHQFVNEDPKKIVETEPAHVMSWQEKFGTAGPSSTRDANELIHEQCRSNKVDYALDSLQRLCVRVGEPSSDALVKPSSTNSALLHERHERVEQGRLDEASDRIVQRDAFELTRPVLVDQTGSIKPTLFTFTTLYRSYMNLNDVVGAEKTLSESPSQSDQFRDEMTSTGLTPDLVACRPFALTNEGLVFEHITSVHRSRTARQGARPFSQASRLRSAAQLPPPYSAGFEPRRYRFHNHHPCACPRWPIAARLLIQQKGNPHRAVELLEEMKELNLKPSTATLNCVLSAYLGKEDIRSSVFIYLF